MPNLGVVEAGDVRYTVADVPGLIPGASQGKGLGLEFLRHVERCSVLVHVIDAATLEPGRDPLTDLDVIEAELAAYGGLDDRPRLVALNKVDVPDARDLAEMVTADLAGARAAGVPGQRRRPHRPARAVLRDGRAGGRAPGPRRRRPRPPGSCCGPGRSTTASSRSSATATASWSRGRKPTRWVRQTDFANDEAVGYLADRLARLGRRGRPARGRRPGR